MANSHITFDEDGHTWEYMLTWTDSEFAAYWGKKCPDYEPHCACCMAWRIRGHERAAAPQRGEQ